MEYKRKKKKFSSEMFREKTQWKHKAKKPMSLKQLKRGHCLDLGLYGNCKGTWSTELQELICISRVLQI